MTQPRKNLNTDHRDLLAKKIKQCQQGRREGFAWLLEQYGSRLYAYFCRTAGSAVDADDLLQELFVRLIEKINHYHHKGRFEQWLFRVAANIARDHARQQRRTEKLFSQRCPDHDNADIAAMASSAPLPDQQAQAKQQQEQLNSALGQLNELDREIILLRHYGQLSFKEIAEHFQIPIGTALAKVHRGLKRLRQHLKGQDNE